MAKLNPYFQSLQNSIYGSEARSPIANLLTNINSNAEAQITAINAQADNHRNIWRGANLGASFTSAQKTAIANGTFDNLYVGDRWNIGGRAYIILDIDYFYGTGRTPLNEHHLVVAPANPFSITTITITMNDTDTTEGAYVGSKMRTNILPGIPTQTFEEAFGQSYILNHDEYLFDSVNSSLEANHSDWYTCRVELMSERMMYGYDFWFKRDLSVVCPRTDIVQFAAFRIRPKSRPRSNTWLRDTSYLDSGPRFCLWASAYTSTQLPTYDKARVWPYALICGTPQS